MAINYEVGKVSFDIGETEKIVSYTNTYNISPVIKITPTDLDNIFISNVTTDNFKIQKSNENQMIIHYIVIAR